MNNKKFFWNIGRVCQVSRTMGNSLFPSFPTSIIHVAIWISYENFDSLVWSWKTPSTDSNIRMRRPHQWWSEIFGLSDAMEKIISRKSKNYQYQYAFHVAWKIISIYTQSTSFIQLTDRPLPNRCPTISDWHHDLLSFRWRRQYRRAKRLLKRN